MGDSDATNGSGSSLGDDEMTRHEVHSEVNAQEPPMIFAERMGHMMNEAALSLMVSVGHRTGLFDTMAAMSAATSAEIAARAGLNERYVREWLGAMTTGKIVDHDGAAGSFSLPADHAAFLTRAAGPGNLAALAQNVALVASVEDQIVDCFRHGGGVPYSAYPRLQPFLAELTGAVYDATLIDVTLPLAPGLVDRLTHGIDVADIGCGSGHAINLMAEAFPRSRFTGFDLSDIGIAAATAEADRRNLTNARFEKRDAARLGETARFDFITTFDSVHDQARPDLALAGIAQALRPGGVYLCVDVAASSMLSENLDHPLGPFFYTMSCMHCMTVSLADGGMGLGAMWGEQKAQEMLTDAGFTSIDAAHVDGDIINTYFIATKG
jgi:SAM-dependent methyltransferase